MTVTEDGTGLIINVNGKTQYLRKDEIQRAFSLTLRTPPETGVKEKVKDNVHPDHYKNGKVECIDAMESAVVNKKSDEAIYVSNVIKYLWRYENKNGIEDVKKAKWYLERLLTNMEKK